MISYKAGAPIAAGGFGCVFRPPLKCKNSKLNNTNGISKLMYADEAEDEIEEINRVKPIIENIKNYKDYFLVDNISICDPAPLSKSDKQDFDKICLNIEDEINENNVNEYLEDFKIINIPDGGEELAKYFQKFVNKQQKNNYDLKAFIATNNSLINLLNKGIIPLNKNNFLHLDIKGANVLRKEESRRIFTRLIDWGLSGTYKSGKIPQFVKNKPLQFNLPFGIILFSKIKWNGKLIDIKNFIKLFPPKYPKRKIAKLIYSNSYKKGHDEYIRKNIVPVMGEWALSQNAVGVEFLKTEDFLPENIIINNISAILKDFEDEEGNFNDVKYFNEVFCPNVDVYGLLICYLPIVLETFKITFIKHPHDNLLINEIWMMLVEFCFSTQYATKQIPVKTIHKKLKNLNNFIYPIKSPKTRSYRKSNKSKTYRKI